MGDVKSRENMTSRDALAADQKTTRVSLLLLAVPLGHHIHKQPNFWQLSFSVMTLPCTFEWENTPSTHTHRQKDWQNQKISDGREIEWVSIMCLILLLYNNLLVSEFQQRFRPFIKFDNSRTNGRRQKEINKRKTWRFPSQGPIQIDFLRQHK